MKVETNNLFPIVESYSDISKEYRKRLLKGSLDLIVLHLLNESNFHGYKLMRDLRKKFDINLGPSEIYPLLKELEKKGYVTSQYVIAEKPRKVYTITQEGRRILEIEKTELKFFLEKMIKRESPLTKWYRKYLKHEKLD